jgi:hypothetical protein
VKFTNGRFWEMAHLGMPLPVFWPFWTLHGAAQTLFFLAKTQEHKARNHILCDIMLSRPSILQTISIRARSRALTEPVLSSHLFYLYIRYDYFTSLLVKTDALAPMEAAAPRIGNLFFTAGTERPTEAPGPTSKKRVPMEGYSG